MVFFVLIFWCVILLWGGFLIYWEKRKKRKKTLPVDFDLMIFDIESSPPIIIDWELMPRNTSVEEMRRIEFVKEVRRMGEFFNVPCLIEKKEKRPFIKNKNDKNKISGL